jgi:hypothetical protein
MVRIASPIRNGSANAIPGDVVGTLDQDELSRRITQLLPYPSDPRRVGLVARRSACRVPDSERGISLVRQLIMRDHRQ